MTPAETPLETPLETKNNDGFAMPTPRLTSTLSTLSTANSTANSTLPSTNSIASTIPGTSASILSTVSNLSAIGSTKHLTPFTPTGDHIKDVDSVPLNFRKLLITAFKVYEEETLIRLDDKKVKTHMNTMLDGMKQKAAARGDKLIIKLKELLDYIPKTYHDWTRSTMQKMFHRNFMQAVCLHLYRDDPDIDMGKIMKMNQFDNLKQQVLCLTPRRFGKTTSVAMFVAAYCLTVPRSEQCIFSTGRRASQKLLELIRDMIVSGRYREMFIKCNQETLMCRGENELDIRKVHSYPSCAKTLRGTGGDVIYLEEAAFMALDVFFEVVVPLLEMETTALIAISTPLDGLNFYSEMFDLKGADGKPLFNTLRVGLSCAKCQAEGKSASCTHMKDVIPPWKSAAKLQVILSLRHIIKQLTNNPTAIWLPLFMVIERVRTSTFFSSFSTATNHFYRFTCTRVYGSNHGKFQSTCITNLLFTNTYNRTTPLPSSRKNWSINSWHDRNGVSKTRPSTFS